MIDTIEIAHTTGPDLVLIDDDPVIRDVWLFEADMRRLRLLALADAREFDDYDLDPDIPIYVDYQLSNGISGVDVARAIHAKGFRMVALSTGNQIDREHCPQFIVEISGKEFPASAIQNWRRQCPS